MKRILLSCSIGTSISVLHRKIQDVVFEEDMDVEIKISSINETKLIGNEYDIVLVAPQVNAKLEELRSILVVPVFAIDQDDFKKMLAKNIIDFALENCK